MSAPTHHIARDVLELSSDYCAPQTDVEKRIAAMWSDIFEITGIGIDDDFFDLNGNSVEATRLSTEIREVFGADFKAGAIVQCPTIRAIAERISDTAESELPSHVMVLREGGTRPPLFIVHGAAGFLFPGTAFMSAFHDDQPVYGFQVPGMDGRTKPLERVEDIADLYLESILTVDPDGPWHLAGMCSGSWIAFEIARRLKGMGKAPGRIMVIDPYIERGRMRDRFEEKRRSESKGPVGNIVAAVSKLKRAQVDYSRKLKVYNATGHWVSDTDDNALAIPEVRDWIIARRRGSSSSEGEEEIHANEKKIARHKTVEAILASEKLKCAFSNYVTEASIDDHVDIIASEFLSRKLANPHHPVRRAMPNNTVIVAGKRHLDTVSTSTSLNSAIMQRLMDDALPVHADREEANRSQAL